METRWNGLLDLRNLGDVRSGDSQTLVSNFWHHAKSNKSCLNYMRHYSYNPYKYIAFSYHCDYPTFYWPGIKVLGIEPAALVFCVYVGLCISKIHEWLGVCINVILRMLQCKVYEHDTNAIHITNSREIFTRKAMNHGTKWLTVQLSLLCVWMPARFHKKV